MNPQQAIEELQAIVNKDDEDYDSGHEAADEILCQLLKHLGYEEIVKVYYEIGKWYS